MLGRGSVAVGAIALLALVYVGFGFTQVVWGAQQHGAAGAQAIVVLGAAQYDGEPSPVLRARLDHVASLYADDVAPLVVVTGGSRAGDRFTEATASAAYLHRQGVPGGAVERETTGGSTYESLAAAARFLSARGVDDVVVVTDPFHAHRVAAISDEVGLDATVSPTPHSAVDGLERWRHLARETVAVSVGRVVGYRRLQAFVDAA